MDEGERQHRERAAERESAVVAATPRDGFVEPIRRLLGQAEFALEQRIGVTERIVVFGEPGIGEIVSHMEPGIKRFVIADEKLPA